ncbi:mitochondrial carrier protein-like protein, partial [Dissoconium aciculare CBS 342.82]|uniref:Mitochondrial carrier protein-like protein n=1 Tax=Dissoconium aciculare CBS 342.82 TaxID=1314786 RepID=A0A6J3MGA9_9PEZI
MSANNNVDIWIAGAFAAFTVDLVVYPLDTIKTRFQSPDYARLYRNGSNTAFSPAMFRGVYQGVGSVIIATLPSSGAFFTTYEGVKSVISNHNPSLNGSPSSSSKGFLPAPIVHAIASGTAELISCAILTPAEVIKQNAQVVDNSSSDRARVNATMQTLRRFRSNPLALWRGYAALAGRNLPFTALQFPMFERIKEGIKGYRDEKGLRTHSLFESGWITAVSAGLGGSVAAVVTTPVDVIKTRIMLPVESAKSAVRKSTRSTSLQIAREILQEHGVKGLFRGGALRAAWTMLGSGLYLGVYESGRLYLAERRGEKLDPEDL